MAISRAFSVSSCDLTRSASNFSKALLARSSLICAIASPPAAFSPAPSSTTRSHVRSSFAGDALGSTGIPRNFRSASIFSFRAATRRCWNDSQLLLSTPALTPTWALARSNPATEPVATESDAAPTSLEA